MLENSLFSPRHPCMMSPLTGVIRQNFWMKLILQKLEGCGYCIMYGENNENSMILTSTVLTSTRVTDGRTDGFAIAYSALSICADC